MTDTTPTSLQPESLTTHMRVLCKEIGPRPPTSAQERRAAEYVKETLKELGVGDVQEQFFPSQSSFGWITIPLCLAGALSVPIAAIGGRWGKLVAGLSLLGGTYTLREFLRARPPFFQELIARGMSQNVIAHIPPAGHVRQHVFLIGHLDSQKQRFMTPPPQPELMKPALTLSLLLSALTGLCLVADALFKRERATWLKRLFGAGMLGWLLGCLFEETQPHIEGANDDATAISVLLGIAGTLQSTPLQHTDVTLLFTGCEEVICVGVENYLRHFAPPKKNTYWIDLEMVGTGDLCYVTKHGLSYVSEYQPAPEMVTLAEGTTRKHPELGVTGKEMLILEEVASLRHWGYQAFCIAGYDEGGWLPNWHRLSDNLENIEPDTLSRAARYTWALLQEIDNR